MCLRCPERSLKMSKLQKYVRKIFITYRLVLLYCACCPDGRPLLAQGWLHVALLHSALIIDDCYMLYGLLYIYIDDDYFIDY